MVSHALAVVRGAARYCWMITPKVITADCPGLSVPMSKTNEPAVPLDGTVVTEPTVVAAGLVLV